MSIRLFAISGVTLFLVGLLAFAIRFFFFFNLDFGVETEFRSGQAARDRLSKEIIGMHAAVPVNLLNATDDCFVFEGGNWNGSISYWMCQCRFIEDCWELAEAWSGRLPSAFEPWQPSEFACVMRGPCFYKEERAASRWEVARVRSGVRYYSVEDTSRLTMIAIDFDRMRVYGVYESGGFPKEKWRPAPSAPLSGTLSPTCARPRHTRRLPSDLQRLYATLGVGLRRRTGVRDVRRQAKPESA